MLVQIVREESGDTLTQTRFNDAMLILFENIAGFEALSRKQSARHLKALWEGYKGHR